MTVVVTSSSANENPIVLLEWIGVVIGLIGELICFESGLAFEWRQP